MLTLGIDPGSLVTGYGLVEKSGSGFHAVDFGTIITNSKEEMPQRLKVIYDGLSVIIKKHKPLKVSLETAFFGKNIQSALKLGQVRGVAMILAMNHDLPLTEYSPREVKKSITGNGNAAKEQVEYMARKLLGIKSSGAKADAFDALAIALCDLFSRGNPPNAISSSSTSKSKDWKKYIIANPHVVIN